MSIENTTRRDRDVTAAVLAVAGTELTTTYITDMEAAGQRQIVASDLLPTDCRDQAALEDLGFTFGNTLADDPMFREATLPPGWTREGSDHAMWSYVLDEQGRRRVSIFYKAAFYDRSAHMGLSGVGEYLRTCAHRNTEPITDDTWATPNAVHAQASALAEEAAEMAQWSHSRGDTKNAAEDETKQKVYTAWVKRFAPVGDAS